MRCFIPLDEDEAGSPVKDLMFFPLKLNSFHLELKEYNPLK